MKKNNIADLPEFPPKKIFFNQSKSCIEQRITSINRYFEQLFELFPQKVPFTNAIIDLCQPLRLSVAVIGSQKSGKSSLIKAFADLLTDQAEFFKAYRRKQAESALFGKGGDDYKGLRVSADFAAKQHQYNEELKTEEDEDEPKLNADQELESMVDTVEEGAGNNITKKKQGKKGIVIKQRKKDNEEIVTPLSQDEDE